MAHKEFVGKLGKPYWPESLQWICFLKFQHFIFALGLFDVGLGGISNKFPWPITFSKFLFWKQLLTEICICGHTTATEINGKINLKHFIGP